MGNRPPEGGGPIAEGFGRVHAPEPARRRASVDVSGLEDAKRPEDDSDAVADVVRNDRRNNAFRFFQPVGVGDAPYESIDLLDGSTDPVDHREAAEMRQREHERDD